MTYLFIAGLLAHLICDFFLQSEWMARNKVSLKHPAAWVHSGIHTAGALIIFPWPVALALGVSHILIDTRVPLQVWRKFYRQTTQPQSLQTYDVSGFVSFSMWQDQAAHLILLCVAVLYCG